MYFSFTFFFVQQKTLGIESAGNSTFKASSELLLHPHKTSGMDDFHIIVKAASAAAGGAAATTGSTSLCMWTDGPGLLISRTSLRH